MSSPKKVRNPKTNRWIKVGGRTYRKLYPPKCEPGWKRNPATKRCILIEGPTDQRIARKQTGKLPRCPKGTRRNYVKRKCEKRKRKSLSVKRPIRKSPSHFEPKQQVLRNKLIKYRLTRSSNNIPLWWRNENDYHKMQKKEGFIPLTNESYRMECRIVQTRKPGQKKKLVSKYDLGMSDGPVTIGQILLRAVQTCWANKRHDTPLIKLYIQDYRKLVIIEFRQTAGMM